MGAGVVFSVIGLLTRLGGSFIVDLAPENYFSVTEWVWIVVNYPARLLFYLWVFKLRLPPQNDVVVYLVLPSVAILLQWLIIGVLVAMWNAYRVRRVLQSS
jgi:hypothetical protein